MSEITELALDLVDESKHNPRRRFDARALEELSASVRQVGVLQPILVRPHQDWRYEVVCGARRLRAAKMAGLTHVPVTIRPLSDLEAAHARLVENNQREDVSPIEEAQAFGALVELGETPEEIANRIGRPARYVRDRLQLLHLPEDVRALVEDGRIRLGAAVALGRLSPSMLAEVLGELRDDWAKNERLGTVITPVTLDDVKDLIRGHQRRMTSAPWSLDDATLAPAAAGACNGCPWRSSTQQDLFGGGDDRCTHQACWDERTAAHWARVRAEAEARGRRVVDEDEAKTLLAPMRHIAAGDSQWIPVAELAREAGVEPVLAPDVGGGWREVYDGAEVAQALEAAGRKTVAAKVAAAGARASEVSAWEERQRERNARDRAAMEQRAELVRHVGGYIEQRGIPMGDLLPILLETWIISATGESLRALLKLHDLKSTNMSADAQAVRDYAAGLDFRALYALFIEASALGALMRTSYTAEKDNDHRWWRRLQRLAELNVDEPGEG